MLTRFSKPPRKFPKLTYFENEEADENQRAEMNKICSNIISSLKGKNIPEKTWAFRGYQIEDDEDRGDKSDRAEKRRYFWYFSIGYQGKNLQCFKDEVEQDKESWISFREADDATETKMAPLEAVCSIGEFDEDWIKGSKAISPNNEDWDQIYPNSISLRWQG